MGAALARDPAVADEIRSLAHEAFPYLRAREIAIGDVPCLALRVTYVGELGYELYCPTEYGLALWDALVAAGEPHGLVPAGYRAIDSLRLEKGYRAWGSDITPETTPEAAGLGFAVRLDKPTPFLGRDALLAEQDCGRTERAAALPRARRRTGGLPGRRARADRRRRPRAGSPRAATGTASSGASPTRTCRSEHR